MGFYQDPYADFGLLSDGIVALHAELVCRHRYQAKQWSREQAIDYLIANTPNPRK